MALSIIFTTTPEITLKSFSVNEPLYYAKLVLKKDKRLSAENILNNRIDNNDNSNSLIKRLFNFHAVFSNID